jgi:hypothetical protein
MSIRPIEWRNSVIDRYGSIAKFHDVSTVEIVRGRIATLRNDLKAVLDLETTQPGVVPEDDLAHTKANDAELAALDAELEQWQLARNQVSA